MPKTDIDSTQIIRKVERSLLDEKYQEFAFYHRPQDLAIPHLLKVFGHVERDIFNTELAERSFLWKYSGLNSALYGLNHCLRWILSKRRKTLVLPSSDWRALDEEALDFLGWGMQYAKVAQDHVVWSRGVTTGKVNELCKTISFEYPPHFDKFFVLTQAMSDELAMERFSENIPYDELGKHFRAWIGKTTNRLLGGGKTWREEQESEPQRLVLSWLEDVVWPGLSPVHQLASYTLDDFRRFFAALFVESLFCSWAEDHMDRQFGPDNDAGSLIMASPKPQMVEWLSEISGVNRRAIIAILENLIFDATDFHASVKVQPFIQSRRGQVFLLGRMIAKLNPLRMIAGTLNVGNRHRIYDGLSQSLEQASLDDIGAVLRSKGYEVRRESTLSDENGNVIKPDFLLYNRQTQELLVIDYKHTLTPLSVSQVVSKSKTLNEGKEGINQVRRYVEFLRRNWFQLRNWIGEVADERSIFGLLLFRWPMPIPIQTDFDIDVIDWASLDSFLSHESMPSFTEISKWVRTRPDLGIDPASLCFKEEQIKVSDWTYIHQSIVSI